MAFDLPPPPKLWMPPRPAIVRANDLPKTYAEAKKIATKHATFPFPVFCPRSSLTEVLFDRTLGTNIGDMTAQGGLAASFDGTTSAAQNTSGVSQTPGNVTSSYVGKNYSAVGAHGVSKVIAYGSTDYGFNNNLGTVTLTLYGKNGSNPSNATDGTSLGSVTFTDVSNQSAGKTITSGDTVTLYDRFWVTISSGSGAYKFAELQFYLMQ